MIQVDKYQVEVTENHHATVYRNGKIVGTYQVSHPNVEILLGLATPESTARVAAEAARCDEARGELVEFNGIGVNRTPEHRFVPVKAQTGCARCGYARGHHPTAAQLKAARS